MEKSIEFVLRRALQLHAAGNLALAEMWNIVADRLEHENVESALDHLPDEQKHALLLAFSQSPASVNLSLPPADVRTRVSTWLRSNCN